MIISILLFNENKDLYKVNIILEVIIYFNLRISNINLKIKIYWAIKILNLNLIVNKLKKVLLI